MKPSPAVAAALSTRQHRRFRRMVKMLHEIAENRRRKRGFSLLSWESQSLVARRSSDRPACGTAACAAGFAMRDPILRKEGLRPEKISRSTGYIPCFKRSAGLSAMSAFLGIPETQSHVFFCPVYYCDADRSNPLAVANRMQEWYTSATSI